jgi:hypothetical protein
MTRSFAACCLVGVVLQGSGAIADPGGGPLGHAASASSSTSLAQSVHTLCGPRLVQKTVCQVRLQLPKPPAKICTQVCAAPQPASPRRDSGRRPKLGPIYIRIPSAERCSNNPAPTVMIRSGLMGVKRYELSEAQWSRTALLLPGKVGDPGRTALDNRLFVNGGYCGRARTGPTSRSATASGRASTPASPAGPSSGASESSSADNDDRLPARVAWHAWRSSCWRVSKTPPEGSRRMA